MKISEIVFPNVLMHAHIVARTSRSADVICPTCLEFVDFEKAFDSVHRESRWNSTKDNLHNSDVIRRVGSSGLMVRAPACRSRGRWFDSTSAVSKLGQFRSPHFACVFRKRHEKPLVQTPALAQDWAVWSLTT